MNQTNKGWKIFGIVVIILVIVFGCIGPAMTGVIGGAWLLWPRHATAPVYQPTTAPATTDAPVVLPTPTPDRFACDNTTTSHCLVAGETWTVPQGWNISGDIKVNGVSLYDNVAETGLVVHFNDSASVTAPWGAFASADLSANEMVTKLKTVSGCGSLCETVVSTTWPK